MDMLAIVGAVIAFGTILAGNSLEGGQLMALLDGPAALIVIGGTLGAVILQTPRNRLIRALRIVKWVFQPPPERFESDIAKVAVWSRLARREGLLGLENIANQTKDPFSKKGLELVIDGADPDTIRRLLETDSDSRAEFDLSAAAVFKSMGGYAPTIGILGAVIGLIQVLGHLSDPDQLGTGIATAFVATIYGVGFANLLFLPIAERLRSLVLQVANADNLLIEGLIAIVQGEHPKAIELRLQSFVVGENA